MVFQPNLEVVEGGNGDSSKVRVGGLRKEMRHASQVRDGRGFAGPGVGSFTLFEF